MRRHSSRGRLWAQRCRLVHCSDRAGDKTEQDGQDWPQINLSHRYQEKSPRNGGLLTQSIKVRPVRPTAQVHHLSNVSQLCRLWLLWLLPTGDSITCRGCISGLPGMLEILHITPSIPMYTSTNLTAPPPLSYAWGALLTNHLNTSPKIEWWWIVITNRATK